jgi:hypothetical protein
LLGRAAAVSSLIKRIERMASSTKEARLFHKLTAKSRPSKKYCSLPSQTLDASAQDFDEYSITPTTGGCFI